MTEPSAPAAGTDDPSAWLLAWYDRHRRVLPWRAGPGQSPDPYHVWLSEIMLQQTTVAAVAPYFQDFLDRWPTVADLAAARLDDVLHAWQGLGYYARARNLYRCARLVAAEYGGRFPADEESLRRLPGVGAYTAAAISAIAFGRRAVVVDGNVERVMARLHGVEEPLPRAKTDLRRLAAALTPATRPGDYAQAVMDLGATVCTPRAPKCMLCPWAVFCTARRDGTAEALPRRKAAPARPTRYGTAFVLLRDDGAILLRRRPENGLLGGMMEVPSTEWHEGVPPTTDESAPAQARWRPLPGVVRHTFTHFHLELEVLTARVPAGASPEGVWCLPDRLGDQALPTVMKKIVRHAVRHAG